MSSQPTESHDLFSLQTGLTLAITHYSERPRPELAHRIAAQLDAILAHPQLELFPDERRIYARMRALWRLRTTPSMRPNVVAFAAP